MEKKTARDKTKRTYLYELIANNNNNNKKEETSPSSNLCMTSYLK